MKEGEARCRPFPLRGWLQPLKCSSPCSHAVNPALVLASPTVLLLVARYDAGCKTPSRVQGEAGEEEEGGEQEDHGAPLSPFGPRCSPSETAHAQARPPNLKFPAQGDQRATSHFLLAFFRHSRRRWVACGDDERWRYVVILLLFHWKRRHSMRRRSQSTKRGANCSLDGSGPYSDHRIALPLPPSFRCARSFRTVFRIFRATDKRRILLTGRKRRKSAIGGKSSGLAAFAASQAVACGGNRGQTGLIRSATRLLQREVSVRAPAAHK